MDESFSRWFGFGGDWFNLGLPHYVQMDCRPYSGCKIQDVFCERIMVMMKLKLLKNKYVYEDAASENGNEPAEDDNHGTMVLKQLVEPWAGRGDRVVEVYSNFA